MTLRHFANRLIAAVPPPIGAWILFHSGHATIRILNDQKYRRSAIQWILENLSIDEIVETGTYRGGSTKWFASFGKPVATVEINPLYFHYAKLNTAMLANTTLSLGNSAEFLQTLTQTRPPQSAILFYLDAHWYDHLPLREELSAIFGHFARPVIIIDDFCVPFDPGYGYDAYSGDRTLTMDFIRPVLPPDVTIFFPAGNSASETGLKRGWVVLATDPEQIRHLRDSPFLLEFPTAPRH